MPTEPGPQPPALGHALCPGEPLTATALPGTTNAAGTASAAGTEQLGNSLERLCCALADLDCELYLVGGALREQLRGRIPKDLDILVRSDRLGTAELEAALRQQLAPAPLFKVGEAFGVFKVGWEGEWLDLALPSTGSAGGKWLTDPRLPLRADLARRDFTVNALALRLGGPGAVWAGGTGPLALPPQLLTDLFGGQADLAAGRLRTVGSAADRLAEDPVRLLRAARFAADGLTPDAELTAAAQAAAARLPGVAAERLWQEWRRLFAMPRSAQGLRWLAEVGALKFLVPAWEEVNGLDQHNPHHADTVSEHLLRVVEILDDMNAAPLTKEAGFFHDIGKGRTRTLVEGARGLHGHFYGHEGVGAELTRQTLSRLRAPSAHLRHVSRLVELHMRPGQVQTRAAARRLSSAAGDLLATLLDLYAADRLAHVGEDPARIREHQAFVQQAAADLPRAFSQHQLALGGRDLLALGLTPHQVGAAKRWLMEQVLEGHVPNERGALLDWWHAKGEARTRAAER